MSTNDDIPDNAWESEMSREFDSRVRDLNEAPLSLDTVKGRAVTIKRKRRLAAAGGMLAAAAVIVPVAVFSAQAFDSPDREVPPATSTPTEATDVPASGIALDHLRGATWVRPDGTEIRLDETYDRGTVLESTLVGFRSDEVTGTGHMDFVDEGGEVIASEEVPQGAQVVSNDERTAIAFVDLDGDLVTLWDPTAGEEGRLTVATGVGPNASPAALVGGPSCADDGCRVLVDDGSGAGATRSYGTGDYPDGSVFGEPAPLGVNDATSSGLMTVTTSVEDAGSCSGLYDESTGAYRWETCDHTLMDLNPVGSHLVVSDAYLDGFGMAYVGIMDAQTEEVVARLDPPDGAVRDVVWESDDSVLASVYDYGTRSDSIWRVTTDGSAERVLGPVRTQDESAPALTVLGY